MVVLPSFGIMIFLFMSVVVSCRGEYTGEELCFNTLVLPSLNRILQVSNVVYLFCFMSGRFTGEEKLLYIRSPLYEPRNSCF